MTTNDPAPQSTEAAPANLSQLVRHTIGKLRLSWRHYYIALAIIAVIVSFRMCNEISENNYRQGTSYSAYTHEPITYHELLVRYGDLPDDDRINLVPAGITLIALVSLLYVIVTTPTPNGFGADRLVWGTTVVLACGGLSWCQAGWSAGPACIFCNTSNLIEVDTVEFDGFDYHLTLDEFNDWDAGGLPIYHVYLHRCALNGGLCDVARLNDGPLDYEPMSQMALDDVNSPRLVISYFEYDYSEDEFESLCFQIRANSEDYEVNRLADPASIIYSSISCEHYVRYQ